MLIAQCALAHVCKLDGALGARVHEPVAAEGVELGSSDHFGQLLHIGRLDIHNVEALILNVQVPQVDAQIVAADEGLTVTVDGDAVDVVGMCVGVGAAGHGGDDGVVMGEAREFEIASVLEL